MIPETAWALVPEFLPPDTEPWERIAIAETRLSEREIRAYLWAHAMLRATRDAAIVSTLENYLRDQERARIADVTAGFVPIGSAEDMTRSGTRQSPFQRMMKVGTPSPDQMWALDGEER